MAKQRKEPKFQDPKPKLYTSPYEAPDNALLLHY